MEISKELLSEVLCDNKIIGCAFTSELGFDAVEYVWIGCRAIDDCEEFVDHINIYELVHKCKEWLIQNGYVLDNETRKLSFVETMLLKSNQYTSDYYDMDSKIEIEAIFKACEWILNQKS